MVSMVPKATFFDSPAVMRAADASTRKVLSQFGAFVRTRSRSSIRRRRAVSKPGAPPSSHAGHLKRLIFFAYDPAVRSVVIGPTPFRGTAEAPPLLEEGGTALATYSRPVELWTGERTFVRRGQTLRYQPRPFMGPAFQAELPGLPAMWRDSIRG